MKDKFLEITSYVCIIAAILFQAKRLFYAKEIWVYTETALVCLVIVAICCLVRMTNEGF